MVSVDRSARTDCSAAASAGDGNRAARQRRHLGIGLRRADRRPQPRHEIGDGGGPPVPGHDLERSFYRTAGAKDDAIRGLGLSPVRYYQLLTQMLGTEAALAHDPVTVNRLRRLASRP